MLSILILLFHFSGLKIEMRMMVAHAVNLHCCICWSEKIFTVQEAKLVEIVSQLKIFLIPYSYIGKIYYHLKKRRI